MFPTSPHPLASTVLRKFPAPGSTHGNTANALAAWCLALLGVVVALLGCPGGSRAAGGPNAPAFSKCLPANISLNDVTTAARKGQAASGKISVREKLTDLRASCRGARLVDGSGRRIYFFRLTGCWGNPPAGYLEILKRQREKLLKLKERHTFVELPCNPSGRPIP